MQSKLETNQDASEMVKILKNQDPKSSKDKFNGFTAKE
jgi:hypothetical protein